MKLMKTKLLLTAALVGAASLSAQAGVHFGFSFGLPLPVPVIAVAAPVVVAAPVCSAPEVVVAAPACPGPEYVWTEGYWRVSDHRRAWVAGCWQYRPAHVVYGHEYGHEHGWRR